MKSESYTIVDISKCRKAGDVITKKYVDNQSNSELIDELMLGLGGKFPICIPPVQRGLVWSAEQVGTLWDSIIKDIPIGALLAYKNVDNDKVFELVDGQQRCNAIKCGYEPQIEDKYRVWVSIIEKTGELKFNVCSESQPWGFNKELKFFSHYNREIYNICLKNEDKDFKIDDLNNEEKIKSYFKIAGLEEGYPMSGIVEDVVYIPLCYAFQDNGFEKWEADTKLFRNPHSIFELYAKYDEVRKFKKLEKIGGTDVGIKDKQSNKNQENAESFIERLKTNWHIIHKILKPDGDKKSVLNYEIPLQIFDVDKSKDSKSYIYTIFERINRQGTELSDEDALYSALCALMGTKIKKHIDDLSNGFMPSPRLASWAVRMFLIIDDKKFNAINANYKFEQIKHGKHNDFVDFCKPSDGELAQIIAIIRKIYVNDGVHVSPLIYLEDKTDNWLTVIACLIHKFRTIFNDDSVFLALDKKRGPRTNLLALLPYLLCAKRNKHTNFATAFWNGVLQFHTNLFPNTSEAEADNRCNDLIMHDACSSLLTLIAIGSACAMLERSAFAFPYPSTPEDLSEYLQSSLDDKGNNDFHKGLLRDIEEGWNWENETDRIEYKPFMAFDSMQEIMYYAQRKYLSYISQGLRPEYKEMWRDKDNKPFDMDHIIPNSFWSNERMANSLANFQIYYFRHNRGKQANYSAVRNISNEIANELFIYPKDNEYASCVKSDSSSQRYSDYKNATAARWLYLIKTVYDSIGLCELISRIEDLSSEHSHIPNHLLPNSISIAIHRYKLLNSISKYYGNLDWATLVCRDRSYYPYYVLATSPLQYKKMDFYHSLHPFLYCGREIRKGDKSVAFSCISIDAGGTVKYGEMRPYRVSSLSNLIDDRFRLWKSNPNHDDIWDKSSNNNESSLSSWPKDIDSDVLKKLDSYLQNKHN